jgi:hypothetical protein
MSLCWTDAKKKNRSVRVRLFFPLAIGRKKKVFSEAYFDPSEG